MSRAVKGRKEEMTYTFRLSLGQGLVFLSEMANITSVVRSFFLARRLPPLPPPPHQRKNKINAIPAAQ